MELTSLSAPVSVVDLVNSEQSKQDVGRLLGGGWARIFRDLAGTLGLADGVDAKSWRAWLAETRPRC